MSTKRITMYLRRSTNPWLTRRVSDVELRVGPYGPYKSAVWCSYTAKSGAQDSEVFTFDPELVLVEGWDAPEYRFESKGPLVSWCQDFDSWLKAQDVRVVADYREHDTCGV